MKKQGYVLSKKKMVKSFYYCEWDDDSDVWLQNVVVPMHMRLKDWADTV